MELFTMLIDYFGLEFTATNLSEFIPWFLGVVVAVFLVCFAIKALFWCMGFLCDLLR